MVDLRSPVVHASIIVESMMLDVYSSHRRLSM